MDTYEKKYKEALERARTIVENQNASSVWKDWLCNTFPELKESEGEFTWLTKYIEEEAYSLSMDIRDNEDRIKLKKLQKTLAWLKKQGEQKPAKTVKWSPQEESCICQLESLVKEQWRQAECVHNSVNIKKMQELMFFLKTLNPNKKPQRMISAEAKEAMYNKPADTVEPKYEESKTRIFDTPTPFEDKLYAFVLACEILVDPSKREFILEHSQEILDAAKEQIGKEQSSTWSKEDERLLNNMIIVIKDYYNDKDAQSLISWLKSLKPQSQWKPSDEQMTTLYKYAEQNNYDGSILTSLYNDLKKLREE